MNTLETTIIEHPFLKTMRSDHIVHLLKNAREQEFHPGEYIFHQGDPANCLYLIESGEVAIESNMDGDPVVIQLVKEGEALGWSWLFPPFCWHFQARATQPTRAALLDGAHLLVTAEEDSEFGYELMKRIAQILIERLRAGGQKIAHESEHRSTAR